ncbi:hypothetical protein JW916_12320 [Candidatus Sumerlaeota bacterium]|nr:hypothetical protein [Candidatus Sumerlaeota bacterium]
MRKRDREHHTAIAIIIPMVALVAIFASKWIWLVLVAAPLIVLAEQLPRWQGRYRMQHDGEVDTLAQAIHTDLEKMEKRIESLETILIEHSEKR